MNDLLIRNAKDYIRDLYSGNSDGHDLDHSLRVYSNAMLIAVTEPDCNIEAVALAALLHDADDHKLFDTEGNENAVSFLKSNGVDNAETEFIVRIINSVSFSKNRDQTPDSLEGQIVQDADRLDAMGAIGIARTFAYGGKHGRSLESSIDHFHEKLLLLKDGLNTAKAREMASARHEFLEEFIGHFNAENTTEV
ncbi:MAG: HD domain-containing protein [Clostridiales bacterium]|nr:HD domain-containing protein [Clostridiales bacterium]